MCFLIKLKSYRAFAKKTALTVLPAKIDDLPIDRVGQFQHLKSLLLLVFHLHPIHLKPFVEHYPRDLLLLDNARIERVMALKKVAVLLSMSLVVIYHFLGTLRQIPIYQ
uniref:Uncharacterized protein n=1 Tax=Glossina pallidipes TaxID=7398 RepID=A0A1B0A121_GLOPL